MSGDVLKIGVVSTGTRLDPSIPDKVQKVAADLYPTATPNIVFHPQCFLSKGHFAGSDSERAAAFLEIANDPTYDVLWFGRGGYGAFRLLDLVTPKLNDAAREKTYLGYSDAGSILAALYQLGFPNVFHGPMATDVNRVNGASAIIRALSFMAERIPPALEPTVQEGVATAAFNITILSHLIGTVYVPDLTGHVLMLEDVAEYMYRTDRDLFHITSSEKIRSVAGIKMGRCSDVPENDPKFGMNEQEVAEHCCARAGIPYLGVADIGHDVENKIVPFGQLLIG
jgi:muramoyltetrapeptide carboxypeptidase